jgi:hypothetical protein
MAPGHEPGFAITDSDGRSDQLMRFHRGELARKERRDLLGAGISVTATHTKRRLGARESGGIWPCIWFMTLVAQTCCQFLSSA